MRGPDDTKKQENDSEDSVLLVPATPNRAANEHPTADPTILLLCSYERAIYTMERFSPQFYPHKVFYRIAGVL
jgi:hypothetical protein